MRDLCREVWRTAARTPVPAGSPSPRGGPPHLLDEGARLSLPLAESVDPAGDCPVRQDALDAPTWRLRSPPAVPSSADRVSPHMAEHDRRLLEAVLGDPGGLAADDDIWGPWPPAAAPPPPAWSPPRGAFAPPAPPAAAWSPSRPVTSRAHAMHYGRLPNHLYLAGTRHCHPQHRLPGLKPVHGRPARGHAVSVWDPKGRAFRPLFNSARELMLGPDRCA